MKEDGRTCWSLRLVPSSAILWWRTQSLRAGGCVRICASPTKRGACRGEETSLATVWGDALGETMAGASKVVEEAGGGVGEREQGVFEARRGGGMVSQSAPALPAGSEAADMDGECRRTEGRRGRGRRRERRRREGS